MFRCWIFRITGGGDPAGRSEKVGDVGCDHLDSLDLAESNLLLRWLRDQCEACGGARSEDDVRQDHALSVSGQSHSEQEVLAVSSVILEEVGDGKAAHQLGDIVDIVRIGGNIGRVGQWAAHGFEQDWKDWVHLALVHFAIGRSVIGVDAEAEVRSTDPGDAADQGVRGVCIRVLELCVAVDVHHIARTLRRQPVVQGGPGP